MLQKLQTGKREREGRLVMWIDVASGGRQRRFERVVKLAWMWRKGKRSDHELQAAFVQL
jgi:hypothetical protein